MAEIISCPNCQRSLQVPEQFVGQQVECPECRHRFLASAAAVTAQPPPPPPIASPKTPPPPAKKRYEDDEGEEERPRRKRWEDDDDDEFADDTRFRRRIQRHHTPHRGGLILGLGLVSLVGGWMFCLPVVVGPIAWILGTIDLREMREGRMDPSGEGVTRSGQVCGIIATIFLVGALLFLGLLLAATLAG